MAASRIVKYVLLVTAAFAIGAALAVWQRDPAPETAPVEASAGLEGAPQAEAPMDMPDYGNAQDVIIDAPEMPAPPPPSAADAVPPVATPLPAAIAGAPAAGAFALTDHTGAPVTNASWPGKFKLVFFGFTNCPEICPSALEKMTLALQELGAEAAGNIQPLLVTVDPERDTVEKMALYLGGYPGITGLTGSEQQIKDAMKAYKVYAIPGEQDADGGYMYNHTAFIYLVSPEEQTLEVIDSKLSAAEMVEKIRPHVQQQQAPAPAVVPIVTPEIPEASPTPGALEQELDGLEQDYTAP